MTQLESSSRSTAPAENSPLVADANFDQLVFDSMRPISALMAVLYALCVVFDAGFAPPATTVALVGTDLIAFLVFVGLWWVFYYRRVHVRWANPLVFVGIAATTLCIVTSIGMLRSSVYHVYMPLIVFAAGGVLYSARWFAAAVALVVAAWAPVAWSTTSHVDVIAHVLVLVAAIFVASGVQLARRRARLKLERETADRLSAREELAARERHFRNIIESTWDVIMVLDPKGVVKYVTPAVKQVLSVAPAEIEGQSLMSYLHSEDREKLASELAGTEEVRTPRMLEVRLRDRSGGYHITEVCYRDLDSGPERQYICNLRDITQRRELEVRIARADRLASVGMLAAGVAHEINNPLTYLRAGLEHLQRRLPSLFEINTLLGSEALQALRRLDAKPEAVDRVSRSVERSAGAAAEIYDCLRDALDGTQRISRIVSDLKTFSRVREETGTLVHLSEVIESALRMVQNEIQVRARVVRDLQDVPPIFANASRLCQVFVNLLLNSAQAIDEGNVEQHTIRVSTWLEGGRVVAEVADSGRGIAPEHLRRLFQPFFTTKPPGSASGLGLTISDNIVKSCGGQLEVQSEPGRGTQVRVYLPPAAERVTGLARTSSPKSEELTEVHPRRGRILVVDDEPKIGSGISRALREEHDVVLAGSGAEAKSILEKDSAFDLILSDIIMPKVSGAELYNWVRENLPHLAGRIVFMSGGGFTQRSTEFIDTLANDYLEKPLRIEDLKATIQRFVSAA